MLLPLLVKQCRCKSQSATVGNDNRWGVLTCCWQRDVHKSHGVAISYDCLRNLRYLSRRPAHKYTNRGANNVNYHRSFGYVGSSGTLCSVDRQIEEWWWRVGLAAYVAILALKRLPLNSWLALCVAATTWHSYCLSIISIDCCLRKRPLIVVSCLFVLFQWWFSLFIRTLAKGQLKVEPEVLRVKLGLDAGMANL